MSIELLRDIPLAPFTTLKIGGSARFFVRAETEDNIREALAFAENDGLSVFVLGGGSNLVVSDGGFDGLVLQMGLKGVSIEGEKVAAGAGEEWDPLVERCVASGLGGLECMSGIPGSVGGTPVQNVGAYGQEVSGSIESVRCYDRECRELVDLTNADCGFAYRTSIFNTVRKDRYIVTCVTYRLRRDGPPNISYRDLQTRFPGTVPSLPQVRDAVISIRREKSMVIDPNDPNSLSAGSFFKNPIVSRERLEALESEAGRVPFFDAGDMVKIPAAWLVERAGFPKGYVHGNAGISSNHSLALINRGAARAADIIALKSLIQDAVEGRFGILLQPEPVMVGF